MNYNAKTAFRQSLLAITILIYVNLIEGIYVPYTPLGTPQFTNYLSPFYPNVYGPRAVQVPLNVLPRVHEILPPHAVNPQFYEQRSIPVVGGGYPLLGRHQQPVYSSEGNYYSPTRPDYTPDVESGDQAYYYPENELYDYSPGGYVPDRKDDSTYHYSLNPLRNLFSKFSVPNVGFKKVIEYGNTDLPMADCMLKNKTILSHGETWQVYCDTWACINGEIVKPPSPSFADYCPDDFETVDKLGCVKLVDERKTWCDARKACFAMGADLVSLDNDYIAADLVKNIDNIDPLTDFLASKEFDDDVWIGLHRTKSDLWDFTIGNSHITHDSELWLQGDPNEVGQWQCVRYAAGTASPPQNGQETIVAPRDNEPGLSDRYCNDRSMPDGGYFAFICEVPGFDKGGCNSCQTK